MSLKNKIAIAVGAVAPVAVASAPVLAAETTATTSGNTTTIAVKDGYTVTQEGNTIVIRFNEATGTKPAETVASLKSGASETDGSVRVEAPADAKEGDTITLNVIQEDHTPATATLTRQKDGSWKSDNHDLIVDVAAGQPISVSEARIKDGSTVQASYKSVDATAAEKPVEATAGKNIKESALQAATRELLKTDDKDGSVTVTFPGFALEGDQVVVDLMKEDASTVTVYLTKAADGTFKSSDTTLIPNSRIEDGFVKIPEGSLRDGSTVSARYVPRFASAETIARMNANPVKADVAAPVKEDKKADEAPAKESATTKESETKTTEVKAENISDTEAKTEETKVSEATKSDLPKEIKSLEDAAKFTGKVIDSNGVKYRLGKPVAMLDQSVQWEATRLHDGKEFTKAGGNTIQFLNKVVVETAMDEDSKTAQDKKVNENTETKTESLPTEIKTVEDANKFAGKKITVNGKEYTIDKGVKTADGKTELEVTDKDGSKVSMLVDNKVILDSAKVKKPTAPAEKPTAPAETHKDEPKKEEVKKDEPKKEETKPSTPAATSTTPAQLPKTGDTSAGLLELIGASGISGGGIVGLVRKRRIFQ